MCGRTSFCCTLGGQNDDVMLSKVAVERFGLRVCIFFKHAAAACQRNADLPGKVTLRFCSSGKPLEVA